ncbi:MAG: formyltetrahydrofolate deformylase, partial [Phycisphaerales bacterium]|nr:formyltetrahydrofolate deformylase [Phycisphaerales bacterium]
ATQGGNLLDLDQHTVAEHGEFFLRAEFEPGPGETDAEAMAAAFRPVAERYDMSWRTGWSNTPRRVAVMVSRELHCLVDLIWRFHAEELPGEIVTVISNHPDAAGIVEDAGIPFVHLPIEDGDKAAQETKVRQALQSCDADLVVLARYMQILSEDFVGRWEHNLINVHHSFLPAFPGADPYRQAYERGVKMIGATAHYVTPVLDEGPIIAQAVGEVDHCDSVVDLRRTGRDLERSALARALHAHLEDRVLAMGNRTIVFR